MQTSAEDVATPPLSDTPATGAPPPPAVATAIEHPFEFRGDAREYFRIWIVNLALTVLTLGVFSAWAKVRSQRWFYGNTWVAGAPFQYLAQPLPILRGRLIAVAFLGGYVLAGQFMPLLEPVLLLVLAIATPWLVVSGLRFRARYSAWRGLNFRFAGTLGDAFACYFLIFLLLLPTLGFIFPHAKFLQRRYVVQGHRFGGQAMTFQALSGDFYTIYVLGWVIGAAAFVAIVVGLAVLIPSLASGADGNPDMESVEFVIMGISLLSYGMMFVAWAFIAARVTNLTFNRAQLGAHGFVSNLRARDLLWLYFSNTLAILASLGLLVPWAEVRMARYRASRLRAIERGDLLELRSTDSAQRGAAGAETADVFDVDLSL